MVETSFCLLKFLINTRLPQFYSMQKLKMISLFHKLSLKFKMILEFGKLLIIFFKSSFLWENRQADLLFFNNLISGTSWKRDTIERWTVYESEKPVLLSTWIRAIRYFWWWKPFSEVKQATFRSFYFQRWDGFENHNLASWCKDSPHEIISSTLLLASRSFTLLSPCITENVKSVRCPCKLLILGTA